MRFYEELFRKLSEEEVINYCNLNMTLEGGVWKGKCIAKHPSNSNTSFNISNKRFHCWNCGIGGNLIHLIEFYKFGTISKKEATNSFKQARDIACDLAGINRLFSMNLSTEEIKELEERQQECYSIYEILSAIAEHTHKYLVDNFKDLEDKIDLSIEEVKRFKIGYCYPEIKNWLKKTFEKEDLLKTGFVDTEGAVTLSKRILFPYIKDNNTVYFSGRLLKGDDGKSKYKKLPLHSEKNKHVSKYLTNEYFYNENVLDTNPSEVVIAEGLKDCIATQMNGFPCIASGGVSIKNETLLSVLEKTKKIHDVYVCFDSEDSMAGIKSAYSIAQLFLEHKKELRIVFLPRKGRSKIDLQDYFKENVADDFRKLLKDSKTLIQLMMENIEPNTDKFRFTEQIRPMLNLLALCDDLTVDNYLFYMFKSNFKLKPREITLYKNEIKKIRKQLEKEPVQKTQGKLSKKVHELSQGMDFLDGVLYYTIYIRELEEFVDPNTGKESVRVIDTPYLITSEKKYLKITPESLLNEGMFFSKKLISSVNITCPWSTMDGSAYSAMDYLYNDITVDIKDLYLKIKYYFDEYVIFPDRCIATHLAIAIMTSYVLMIFDTVGYIHLHAEKRSGKTRVLEILEGLGFNSTMCSSISDSGLFRVIEATRGMLITDEAENLNPSGNQKENIGEKIQLLNSGYKKSGAAIRVEKVNEEHIPVKYSTYCMKIFAGIKEINNVLADRTITYLLKRVDGKKVKNFSPSVLNKEWESLRDKLYCFAMLNAKRISEIYRYEMPILDKARLEESGIVSRDYELWSPYLAIAKLIDEVTKNEYGVFEDLIASAKIAIEYKHTVESDVPVNRMVFLINEFMGQNDTSMDDDNDMRDYYNVKELANYIKSHEEFEYLKANQLAKLLNGKLFLCKPEEKKRKRKVGENTYDTYVKITKKDIADCMERMEIK